MTRMEWVRSYVLGTTLALALVTGYACKTVNAPVPRLPDPNPAPAGGAAGLPDQYLAVWIDDAATGRGIVGATVRVTPTALGAPADFEATNADGWSGRSVKQGDYHVVAVADGYLEAAADASVTAHTDVHLSLKRPYPFPAEEGRLRAGPKGFTLEDGTAWDWRGLTQFMLFARHLRGEDVRPQMVGARAAGVNVIRVFGCIKTAGPAWPGWEDFLRPTDRSDYPQQLGAFFDLAAAAGLRVEFVPITYRVSVDEGRRLLQAAYDVAAGRWNVLIEGANEAEINMPDIVAAYRGVDRRGVLSAYGLYEPVSPPEYNGICDDRDPNYQADLRSTLATLDYVTPHLPRDDQWPRKAKDLLEYRDGGVGCPRMDGLHKPIVGDEPIGAAEADVPGRRSASASDFAFHFAVCRIYAAGCTFHYEAGLQGQLPDVGGAQAAALAAVTATWTAIPAAVHQTCSYTRGGLAEFPLAWSEPDSLRSYAAICASSAWAVAVRPRAGWTPTARGGWRLADAPSLGVLRLER